MESSRYVKGMSKMIEVDGEAGKNVINMLMPVFPDLARLIIEYSFGEIYTRELLPMKEKEIAVIGALTAVGNARPQLKVHLNGALNTGSTADEVKEVILHISGYAGFPAAINAMNALKEIAAERGIGLHTAVNDDRDSEKKEERFRRGEKELELIFPGQTQKLNNSLGEFCPDLVNAVVEFGYGDIYSRGIISRRERQIATIAALTALGSAQEQLMFHMSAALNVGVTHDEIKEILLLMTIYAGFPAAINACTVLGKIIEPGR